MDVRELIRIFLSYMGIDANDTKQRSGSSGSLVRLIAFHLPLPPVQRPYVSFAQFHGHIGQQFMSFADEDGPVIFANGFTSNDCQEVELCDDESVCSEVSTLFSASRVGRFRSSSPTLSMVSQDPEAMAKISALEDQLAHLREQIATIITAQQQPSTSNPLSATPGALPPPPPPLPPPPTPTSQLSVIEMIKRKRLNRAEHMEETDQVNALPNMADVLKGMDKIKLRKVERSPGGTPLRQKPKATEGNDPASLIAAALKRKFAHHHTSTESPDKENSFSGSAFSPGSDSKLVDSPVKPPFGQHILKPINRGQWTDLYSC
jgi:hypothetical protein